MNFKTVQTLDAPKEMYERISEEYTAEQLQYWLEQTLDMVLMHMRVCADDLDNLDPTDEAILTVSEPFLFLLGMVQEYSLLDRPEKGDMH